METAVYVCKICSVLMSYDFVMRGRRWARDCVSSLQDRGEAVTAGAPLPLHPVPGQQPQDLEEAWGATARPAPARRHHLK